MVITLRVNSLLQSANFSKVRFNHPVSILTADSRKCVFNAVFVAVEGNQVKGSQYIHDAISNGAKTIITSQKIEHPFSHINYIYVENERKILALLAKRYYRSITRGLHLIGVIGTNGKTTTSTIGYQFFNAIGKSSMVIGTSGVYCDGYEAAVSNTTPDILSIYDYLTIAKKKHIKYVFMEISSIAVDQHRIEGLEYDCLIFTNFSQDHLDYHKTIENYFFCKMIPFLRLKPTGYAIVNRDDPISTRLIKHIQAKVIGYGFHSNCEFIGTRNEVSEYGISFYAQNRLFKSKLLGEFNLYNLLSLVPLCQIYHISYLDYASFLNGLTKIEGRMNRIVFQNKTIIIDYAHTFSATKAAIEECQRLCKGKVHIVIGCGGNREKQKRGMIGAYLNELSCPIYLTTDNPRFEQPESILLDISKPIKRRYEMIVNRREAIRKALDDLKEQDYLLILGKGSENYMEIKGIKYPYSDISVIEEWMEEQKS